MKDLNIFEKIPSNINYEINKVGNIRNCKTLRPIKCRINKKGYYVVTVRENNNTKIRRVHRLIAETFIPNPENKPQVNHLDGNKLNNGINNLEWATCIENITHAISNGLYNNFGERNGNSKLKKEEIPCIKELIKNGKNIQDIAITYNVSRSAINMIKQGVTWNN